METGVMIHQRLNLKILYLTTEIHRVENKIMSGKQVVMKQLDG